MDRIKADALGYWYLRLNGFLTIVDFVVHQENRRDSYTDVDILGIRLPYRAEIFNRPMEDDAVFTHVTDRPYIVIAEAKKGLCDLNGPWTEPHRHNMQKLLRGIGAFPENEVTKVAEHLYSQGQFTNERYHISLFCIGERENEQLAERYPRVPQVTWGRILSFIYRRFREYRHEKKWHDHWDIVGNTLYRCADESRDEIQFARMLEIIA